MLLDNMEIREQESPDTLAGKGVVAMRSSPLIPVSSGTPGKEGIQKLLSITVAFIFAILVMTFVAVISGRVELSEPAAMLLLGSGLIGLAGYGRKKFFNK